VKAQKMYSNTTVTTLPHDLPGFCSILGHCSSVAIKVFSVPK
jgi:hypothetical protein